MMASLINSTALSWPITLSLSVSARDKIFSLSPCISFEIGIFVHLATTSATASSSTDSDNKWSSLDLS